MHSCPGCHRHVRAEETSCPFCSSPLALTSAPSPVKSSLVALAAGLSMLACTDSGDESGDGNTVTTNDATATGTDTSTSTGDGDGDQSTTDYTYTGADYGGPPPCNELDTAIPLNVGANPVDTTNSPNGFDTTCGTSTGSGPDQVFVFSAPAAGSFSFALTANFDAWLLKFGNYYCYTYGTCVVNEPLDIMMNEGEILHLIMDGTAGGAASIDVTQN